MNTVKHSITGAIAQFGVLPLREASVSLLNALSYRSEKSLIFSPNTFEGFAQTFDLSVNNFVPEKALASEWKSIDVLFQLTAEDIAGENLLFSSGKYDNKIIESFLFIAIELRGTQYSRSDLARVTREINKLTPMPALLFFKYGNFLTLSVIERRLHKKNENKDVLEKVTLIKDISTAAPHRAHIEILHDLSLPQISKNGAVTDFVSLYAAWQKALDTKELNKRFFQELANWYFWAAKIVSFPEDAGDTESLRNAASVIRLITRLIFVWFLKEKGLVPEGLFDRHTLKSILKYSDKNNSMYYKAILQNLFFATLNTETGKRKFRTASDAGNDSHFFIHNVFRYKKEFRTPEETLLEYFDPIPFLNGGLFECLDKEIEVNGKLKRIRVDGFSDRGDNALCVPDELFFTSAEKEVDLNETFGTKNKKYTVRGIIDILNGYKFTITENTPIEEEIALDPELLGRVFENLLASYNPETNTTARKATGSFYTPREIVNYMVDESLAAYLQRSLPEGGDTEAKLRSLLSYSESDGGFSAAEKAALINAIDTVKILDPACGSGAFPMGILHKVVHILHKLDPQNLLWKQRQIDKVYDIPDSSLHEQLRAEIEKTFSANFNDYGRKLYLIQNCIYGVDIQPIAVQIAKLRFFISLIVDQKNDADEKNSGIRPLPNLETKFVAANTLISIEKPAQGMFRSELIDKKEAELQKVREKHFAARTPETKRKYRSLDKALRKELSELLEQSGFNHREISLLAAWDPYNQNSHAEFFDPEWMFGIRSGFDIVIGNPPYGAKYSEREKKFFLMNYATAKTISGIQKGSLDTYSLFIEKGYELLAVNGNLHYIVPISITSSDSMTGVHRLLENNSKEILISNYSVRPRPIFENAVVNTSILFFVKTVSKNEHLLCTKMYRRNENFNLQHLLNNLQFINVKECKLRGRYPKISLPIEISILKKMFTLKTDISMLQDENGEPVYYRTTGGRYYKVITPYKTNSTKESSINIQRKYAKTVGAILSSNLFFWYYQIYSNNLDLKLFEIESFKVPLETLNSENIREIEKLYKLYLSDIEKNKNTRNTNKYANIASFSEYKIGKSKQFIDKIDDMICPLYGLTDDEMEFIKNYELDFRLTSEE